MSLCIAAIIHGQTPKDPTNVNWSDYGGGLDSMSYSPMQQINKSNVNQLEQAWFFPVPGTSARFSFSPLIMDGKMYVLGKGDEIVCLDAATGKEIWSHPTEGTPTDRGINYWESKDRSDRRLIFSADSYLQEIDARTGAGIPTFGTDGRVNLREGLGRDPFHKFKPAHLGTCSRT
jgi:quinoprotein glucose dehydrogenase